MIPIMDLLANQNELSALMPWAITDTGRVNLNIFLFGGLLLLLVFWMYGDLWRRQWVAARLNAYAREQIVQSSRGLRTGLRAMAEFPDATGARIVESTLSEVNKRWVRLTPNTPDQAGFVTPGSPVRVTLVDESAAYCFFAIVKDRRLKGEDIILSRPAWLERLQRREYFRIPLHMPALITSLQGKNDGNKMIRAEIENLSGGGFRVISSRHFEENSCLRVRLNDDVMGGASYEARVLRCIEEGEGVSARYHLQCEFLYITEDTRNMILRFCFDMQKEMLRKRW